MSVVWTKTSCPGLWLCTIHAPLKALPRPADLARSSQLLSPSKRKLTALDVKDISAHSLHNSSANPATQATEVCRSKATLDMETEQIKLPYEEYMALIQSERGDLHAESSLQELPENFELPDWVTKTLGDANTFGRGAKKMFPLLVCCCCLFDVASSHSHPTVRNHTGRPRPRARACNREIGSARDSRYFQVVYEQQPQAAVRNTAS